MGKQNLSWAFYAKTLAKEDASTKAMEMKWQFFYFHYVIIHLLIIWKNLGGKITVDNWGASFEMAVDGHPSAWDPWRINGGLISAP